MKKLISLLFLVACLSSQAANVPQASSFGSGAGMNGGDVAGNSSLTVPLGSMTTAGQTMICGAFLSHSANNYAGMYSYSSPTSVVAYSVPVGKSFYAVNMWILGGATATGVMFGYGTASVISEDTSTAPAGNIVYGPVAGTGYASGFITHKTANNYNNYNSLGIVFPSGSFPWFKYSGTSDIHICMQGVVQ